MPDGKRDITHFTRYFSIEIPKAQYLALLLLLLGAVTGIVTELLVHPAVYDLTVSIVYGASAGIASIAFPAILTALLVKTMNRKLKVKHSFFAVLAITLLYALFLIGGAVIFNFTHNYLLAYTMVLLGNAAIYGYWFMINRVVLNQKRSQIVTAAIQPLLNILLYVPASAYLLYMQFPLSVVLVKLWAGMLVFLLCGYAILYFMDRPSKRELNFSGVELMSAMINQWLYNVVKDHDVLKDSGEERDVSVDILALHRARGRLAAFVKPEIHYGPIAGVGGSGTTEHLGAQLAKSGATPFVLHGAVDLEDNPISHNQVLQLSHSVVSRIGALPRSAFANARGSIAIGRSGPCRAIAIRINDLCMITLTKAPAVTEDMDREVGRYLASVARRYFKNVMLLDAHNARLESASDEELRGVYTDSKYVKMYDAAIRSAAKELAGKRPVQLMFGCASSVVPEGIRQKDLGRGHLSVGLFQFGNSRFCMVYFDSNNVLPSFRSAVLSHIKKRYGLDAELCTTDTHAVNSLSLSAANVLGRHTAPAAILPMLDELVQRAIDDTAPTSAAYIPLVLNKFRVWGPGSEDVITKVSRDVIHLGKRRMPILIAAFFVAAVWVIYLV